MTPRSLRRDNIPAMAGSIRDLKVWQEAVALAADAIRAVRPANRREIKCVVEATMASATLVGILIADGYASPDPGGQHRFYSDARRELVRLETHLAIARHAELIAAPAYQALGVRMQQVHRLLGGYLVYLDRQITAANREPLSGRAPEPSRDAHHSLA